MKTTLTDEQITALVFDACAERPHLLPDIIKYATSGVQAFARDQNDKAGKLTYMMSAVLDATPDSKFGPFSRLEILRRMDCLKGTGWHNKALEDCNVEPPTHNNEKV